MQNVSESPVYQAMKAQLESQISFFAEFSDKMLEGMQKMNELNSQLAVGMLEDSMLRAQQMAAGNGQAVGQPAVGPVEKMRAYQRSMQQVVADTQTGITRILQTHVPQTVRACEAVVREVTQKASEDTAKVTQSQKEVWENMARPTQSTPQQVH